jgi:hypothetical protein
MRVPRWSLSQIGITFVTFCCPEFEMPRPKRSDNKLRCLPKIERERQSVGGPRCASGHRVWSPRRSPHGPDLRGQQGSVSRSFSSTEGSETGGLQRAFEALWENQRQTLRLHSFEGYTFDEIATKLGQSRGNIRNHDYRETHFTRTAEASSNSFP